MCAIMMTEGTRLIESTNSSYMFQMRHPSVSGLFYPGNKAALESIIEEALNKAKEYHYEGRIIGAIVPHAGYVYSGKTAAYVYRNVDFNSKKIFLIGPNHSSYPFYSAVFGGGKWQTPLGNSEVLEEDVKEVTETIPEIRIDNVAHAEEHSLEVQIPFLQHVTGNKFNFVPVVLGNQDLEVAVGISKQIMPIQDRYFILASSDLNHYENEDVTLEKDKKLIDAIISLEPEEFYKVIRTERASPCGFGAIAVLMYVTKTLGGKMILLYHTTSAESSGDISHVVGYASLLAVI